MASTKDSRNSLKRPGVLIFDEAMSSLDQQTAERLARTINRLKGKVPRLLITHQMPEDLPVDEVVNMEPVSPKMRMVKEEIK